MSVLRGAGTLIGIVLTFAVSLVIGVALHLQTPLARRLVAQEVGKVLATSFRGHVRIERLRRLGLSGIAGADVTIEEPGGRPVLVIRGARVRIASLATIGSALFGKGHPLVIRLSNVSIDSMDARLDTDDAGKLELMEAFEPRSPNASPSPNRRAVRVVIPEIVLKHASASGHMASAPPLDVGADDFRGSFDYAPDLLEVGIARARVLARGIVHGSDLDGAVQANLRKWSDSDAHLRAHIWWRGSLGGIAHVVRASLDDQKVDAVIDVPRATPENIGGLWSHSSVHDVAYAHLEGHGTLSRVNVELEAGLGAASFLGRANLVVDREKKARLNFVARDVDVHEFAASAPRSRIGFSGEATAALDAQGGLVGEMAARMLGGTMAGYRLPPVSMGATVSRSDPKDLRARAEVEVQEPTAPTRLSVELSPKGTASLVSFSLDADVPDLSRVEELGGALRGGGRVAARGSLDLGAKTVDADLEGAADDLMHGTTTVRSVAVDAHVRGPVGSPLIDVGLHSKDVVASNIRLASIDVHATGNAGVAHIDGSAHGPDIPDTEVALDVRPGSALSLEHVRIGMARASERALLTIEQVKIGRQDTRVEEARLEGLGAPAAVDLAISPRAVLVRASTSGIDLGRVGRLAHIEQKLERGTVALDADVDLRRDDAYGLGTLDLNQATLFGVHDVTAQVRAHLNGRSFVGKAHAQASGIGFVDIDAPRLELGGGGALSSASWRRAWGDVAVDGRLDLEKAAATIAPESFPLGEARGGISFRGHMERDDLQDLTPDLSLSVVTEGLAVAPKTALVKGVDGVRVMSPPPWRLAGVDFDLDANVDGNTGSLNASAKLHDAKGELAHLKAKSGRPPWGDVLHDGTRLAADLRTTPFELEVAVPERGLGSLPALFRQRYLTGKVRGDLTCSGTMLEPKLHLAATLHQSHVGTTARSLPLEVEVAADYDGSRGSAALHGRMQEREVIELGAEFDGAVEELLDSFSSADWRAAAHARFARFPLDAIAPLDDKLISGDVSGDLALDDLHKDARATVGLGVESLRLGGVSYKSARLDANADGHELGGTLSIEQSDGFAKVRAHAMASWGGALAPQLDPTHPAEVALSAKNFRLAGLLPFLDSWLDEVDGRLDSDTHVELDPGSRRIQLAGAMSLDRGAVETVGSGDELHDIAATLRFSPNGVVTLEKLTAAGITGRVEATGSALLDGVGLRSGRAVVLIPDNSPIPLNAGGSQIGNVDGRIEASEVTSGDGRAMNVTVNVPHFRLALPQGGSKSAQALGEIPKLRIGAYRGHPGTFVIVPLDSTKKKEKPEEVARAPGPELALLVHLNDVQVVRDSDLKIDLKGNIDVKGASAPQVTGQIHLQRGGALVVQGRKFKIENGTVTFLGQDPSNPDVTVKAGWTAPDGTVVYANFVGPLKTGKVTLSSEPPLAQQEIVELLAFGAAGGRQQGPSTSPANSAIGAVGGEAAQPINHALSQLGLGAFSTKVDTSEASNPKPEVEVQIAKDISVQIAVVLGQPPPGVNPDRTLLTIDWRFLSRWSLSSTLGDAGTTVFDLLWQRRY